MWNHRIANECFKVSRDCFSSKNNRAFKKIRNAGFTSEIDNDLGELFYHICDTAVKCAVFEHRVSDIFYISKNMKVKTELDSKAENSIVSMELAVKSKYDIYNIAKNVLNSFDQRLPDFRGIAKSYCLDIPVNYMEKEYHFTIKFTSGRMNKRSIALFMRLDGLPLTEKQTVETVFGGTYVGQ